MRRPPSPTGAGALADVCGISNRFGLLSPAERHITHVLRTRPPLYYRGRSPGFSRDLHVLGLPLTFALSQDQTLQLNLGVLTNSPTLPEGRTGGLGTRQNDVLLAPTNFELALHHGCPGEPRSIIGLLFSF